MIMNVGNVVLSLGLAFPLAIGLPAAPICAADPPPLPKRSDVERVLAGARHRQPERPDERPLQIVLLADRKDHGPGEHDYPRWQSRWALLLGGAAASAAPAANLFGPDRPDPALQQGSPQVRVATANQWPAEEQWRTADVVVAFCYVAWTPDRLAELGRYLERGGGLVVIHSATWTKPEPSADVAALLGVGGFQRWRHGPVVLETTQPQHPICLGLPSELRLEDEPYWPPTPRIDADKVQVLAASREQLEPGQPAESLQPMFWTYQRGQGRVFGCVLGHYSWTFDAPYFRLWLLRGIAWAAGESPYRFDHLTLRSAAVADG
jgi:type 1 glutamine amidotransferase